MKNTFNYIDKFILKTILCLVFLLFHFGFVRAGDRDQPFNPFKHFNPYDIGNNKLYTKIAEQRFLSSLRPAIRRKVEKRGKFLQGLNGVKNNFENKSQKAAFSEMAKKEILWLEEKIKSLDGDSTPKKDEQKELALAQLEELTQLKERFLDCEKSVEGDDLEKIEYLIKDLEKDQELDEKELKYINVVISGGNWGDIILRGIAGTKNWKMIEDLRVGDNFLEGFEKGIMVRTAVSTGNAIGGIIDRYVQTFFDSTLGKVESFVSFLNRVIFHSACRPFIEEELAIWKKLVSDDFREIEMMIKNAEKLDSRSKADILREYETEQEPEVQTLNLWQDFVEDHAFTYEELAQEIGLRKGYYKKEVNGFGVVSCADRLINKLLKIRTWLLSVKSLRDFANIPEAKSIIPAMRKSIDNYFVNLANQVKPLTSKKTTKLDFGESSFSKKDHWGNDFGEGASYPGYMTE